ncbi:MAG TPA: hypothetical protein VHM24_05685, partial [Gemmatimonadaceae bacterium]|nr:hypothetical protein [Gemmatimonadaceae bacterium]
MTPFRIASFAFALAAGSLAGIPAARAQNPSLAPAWIEVNWQFTGVHAMSGVDACPKGARRNGVEAMQGTLRYSRTGRGYLYAGKGRVRIDVDVC